MTDRHPETATEISGGTTDPVVSFGVSPVTGSWRFTSYLSPAALVGHEVRMA